MFDSLKFLQKSGRISQPRFHFASLLQIRPLIKLKDGQEIKLREYRTRNRSIRELCNQLESLRKLENLAVLHTTAEADAIELMARYDSRVFGHVGIRNVTTVIGTHVGPNALGFAAATQDTTA